MSKHNTVNDGWISINFNVYEISNYINKHPGGNIILTYLGKEATIAYNKYHPWVNYEYILKDYYIGKLKMN